MSETTPGPQINVAKIPVGSGIAGAMFTLGSMYIFLVGIPALQYFLLGAIVLGCAVALVIHATRREVPSTSHVFSAPEDNSGSRPVDV